MFCPQCGEKLGEGARFCGSCGAAVPATSSVPPPTFSPKPAPDPRGAGSTSGGLPPGAVPPAGVDIARRARYEGDDGASLTLEIVDLGSLAGLASIAGKFDPSLERETHSGYERTRRVDGNLVHERYDRRSRSGQITALLGERFTIDVSGNRVDAKVLAEALRAVDAKQLLAAAR